MVVTSASRRPRQGDARARRHAVHQQRAGSADAVLAADMRAGEIEAVAQEVGECVRGSTVRAQRRAPLTVRLTAVMRRPPIHGAAQHRRHACGGPPGRPCRPLASSASAAAASKRCAKSPPTRPPNSGRVGDHDRAAFDSADHRAAHGRLRVDQHRADGVGELASLAAGLDIAPAGGCSDWPGTRTASSNSPGRSAVSSAPTMNSVDRRACARPRGSRSVTSAPSAVSAETQSAAGSAWLRLPPMVPRLRTAR